MSQEWYYLKGREPQGPISRAQLSALGQSGEISLQTLVWREGLADWVPLTTLIVKASGPPPPPPPTPSVTPPPVASNAPYLPPKADPRTLAQSRGIEWRLLAGAAVLLLIVVSVMFGWFANALLQSNNRKQLVSAPTEMPRRDMQPPGNVSNGSVAPNVAADPNAAANQPARADLNSSAAPTTGPTAGEPATDQPVLADPFPPLEENVPGSAGGRSTPVENSDPLAGSGSAPPAGVDPATQPSEPAPSTPMPSKPAAPDYVVYQEIEVQRTPQFSIAGTVIAQDLKYKLLSELHVGVPDERGVRQVDQVIKGARLIAADELSQAMFEKSLRELVGWQFTADVNARGEVIGWHSGPKDGRGALEVKPKAMDGFLVTSVMDEDGWKELTQLSFFVPDAEADTKPWSRQMTHDYGPLGGWSGMTHFQKSGVEGPVTRFNYRHEMTYLPPKEDSGGLPFKIIDARFAPDFAGGQVDYDSQARRVVAAQESFVLRGVISAEILGQLTTVETLEQQTLVLRLTSEQPGD